MQKVESSRIIGIGSQNHATPKEGSRSLFSALTDGGSKAPQEGKGIFSKTIKSVTALFGGPKVSTQTAVTEIETPLLPEEPVNSFTAKHGDNTGSYTPPHTSDKIK